MRFIKILSLALALFCTILCFVSCNDSPDVIEDVYYTVTFNTMGGTQLDSIKVLAGSKIGAPTEPEKEGYIFSSWKNGSTPWDFSSDVVNSDITLNAAWLSATSLFEYRVVGETAIITGFLGGKLNVKIPKVIEGMEVVAIDDHAFEGLNKGSLAEVIIGENIRRVGESAFSGNSDVKIIVESKLEYIGQKAFLGCDGLERIELGKGLEEIPFEAFSGCAGLKEVILPDTVQKIGENAFELCTSLTTLVAHESLKRVEDSAFVDCTALDAVYYYGNATSWEKTEISDGNRGNEALKAAKLYIYSETEPSESADGDYWYFSKNGKIRIW